jgi:transcriptional regulator with XRE-family HTH domain
MPQNIGFNREIGKRIASIRKSQGATQEKLAHKLGIKQPILAHYENGLRKIPIALVPKIAEALHVEIEDLFGIPPKGAKRGPVPLLIRKIQLIQDFPPDKKKLALEMINSFIDNLMKAS